MCRCSRFFHTINIERPSRIVFNSTVPPKLRGRFITKARSPRRPRSFLGQEFLASCPSCPSCLRDEKTRTFASRSFSACGFEEFARPAQCVAVDRRQQVG